MATRTRKSTSKPEAPAPRQPKFPTIKVGSDTVPDVLAMRESGMKWVAVASATKLSVREAVLLGWRLEIVKDPSLKFNPTAKNVVEARKQGVRWGRIALRAGIGESAARKLFETETGISSDSNYSGLGRKFVPMKGDPLPVGYKQTHVLKDGVYVLKGKASAKPRRKAKATKATA